MRQLSMATATNNIKNSWSLVAFAQKFGKPKLAKCANHETGEQFSCVAFGERDNMTFVSFSPKIGELSPKEIAAQKDELQVVQCETKDGREMYSLCHKGADSWEDIDL